MRTLIALGVGAAAMYLLDREQGRRRRALLRDQLVQVRRAVRAQLERGKPSRTPESAQQHPGR